MDGQAGDVGSTLAYFDAEGRITTLPAGDPTQTYAAETLAQAGTLDNISGLGAISPDGNLILFGHRSFDTAGTLLRLSTADGSVLAE